MDQLGEKSAGESGRIDGNEVNGSEAEIVISEDSDERGGVLAGRALFISA